MRISRTYRTKITWILLITLLISCAIYYYYTKLELTNFPSRINLKTVFYKSLVAAQNGGRQVLSNRNHLNVNTKGLTQEGLIDQVTNADYLSHCAMVAVLNTTGAKLISEEETNAKCGLLLTVSDDNNDKTNTQQLDDVLSQLEDEWVDTHNVLIWIDPLDATYEYIEKLYQYVTTMVCVVVGGKPLIGIIHNPMLKETWWGWANRTVSMNFNQNEGKSFNQSTVSTVDSKEKIIISRSHSGGDLKKLLQAKNGGQQFEVVTAAGAGYKVVQVATGNVDAYIHITAIKKWDICAGDAILRALGGQMTTRQNREISYADQQVENLNGIVATLRNHQHFIDLLI